jgi:hypothetical protein
MPSAKPWYVKTETSSPASKLRYEREVLMRSSSSPAALCVKVSPRTSEGVVCPVTTRCAIRAAMTAVFPDPAPAITERGAGACSIAALCSADGVKPPSAARIAGCAPDELDRASTELN